MSVNFTTNNHRRSEATSISAVLRLLLLSPQSSQQHFHLGIPSLARQKLVFDSAPKTGGKEVSGGRKGSLQLTALTKDSIKSRMSRKSKFLQNKDQQFISTPILQVQQLARMRTQVRILKKSLGQTRSRVTLSEDQALHLMSQLVQI